MARISKFKKIGFTLAEVLIVLGVIGIVASMTIPTLINNTNNKEFDVALKKGFSVLSQAIMRVNYDNGGTLLGLSTANYANAFTSKLKPYLSYSKVCELAGNIEGICWHAVADVTLANGSTCQGGNVQCQFSTNGTGFVLNDGMLIDMAFRSIYCLDHRWSSDDACGWGYIDVNGWKGPNKFDSDIFQFIITKDRVIPFGAKMVQILTNQS